ncbi:hypothetical protein BDV28DRAFT_83085 [Aspergillus coremiiformis]|uniref:Uncharacterized protein n=1 Tax=Aspergillus coremiiformis TaxID=138285 RepID=A0A5N6ZI95_9EURO|nr:hypothetical protein BDV28DRAFT_83085 [Aspergillus coremiiformis]
MKRSRSRSPALLAIKQHKPLPPTACLTTDALEEHNQNTPPLPLCALLDMALEERAASLSDLPIMPPPSTRSSQSSRSSTPTRPSDAQYRGGHLRRAKIFVGDEIPESISHYVDTSIFHNLINYGNDYLHQVSEKLWRKAKELERRPSGEAEWTEALYAAINDIKPAGFEAVRNRGKLAFPPVSW